MNEGDILSSKIVFGFGDPPSRILDDVHIHLRREGGLHSYTYQPISLNFAALERSFSIMQSHDVLGCHFALPLQINQLPWLGTFSPAAQSSGYVNVLYKEASTLIGENTIVSGALRALEKAGFKASEADALLLGTNNEAQSIVRSLAQRGLKKLLILHNSNEVMRSLAFNLKREAPELSVMIGSLSSEDLGSLLDSISLVINALPLAAADGYDSRLIISNAPQNFIICDLVAVSLQAFNTSNESDNYINASHLLLWEICENYRLWNKREAPIDLLIKFLNNAEYS